MSKRAKSKAGEALQLMISRFLLMACLLCMVVLSAVALTNEAMGTMVVASAVVGTMIMRPGAAPSSGRQEKESWTVTIA